LETGLPPLSGVAGPGENSRNGADAGNAISGGWACQAEVEWHRAASCGSGQTLGLAAPDHRTGSPTGTPSKRSS